MEPRRPRGRVAKVSTTSPANPHPNPLPQFTKAPEQPKVTATREMARPQKPEPKSTVAPKRTAEKPKKSAASAKPAAAKNTPKPGGPHPKFHLLTRGYLRSPRPPYHPRMRGPDTSDPRVHLLYPPRSSSHAGCPKGRLPFRDRIWQHALGGQNGTSPFASPAGMRTECAAGSSNWSIFLASTVSIFVS